MDRVHTLAAQLEDAHDLTPHTEEADTHDVDVMLPRSVVEEAAALLREQQAKIQELEEAIQLRVQRKDREPRLG
jgi:hypothetical protein